MSRGHFPALYGNIGTLAVISTDYEMGNIIDINGFFSGIIILDSWGPSGIKYNESSLIER